MKNTYLFELKNADYISCEASNPKIAYKHIITHDYVKACDIVSCYHIGRIETGIVKFGLDLLPSILK